jgi:hypothetical protein
MLDSFRDAPLAGCGGVNVLFLASMTPNEIYSMTYQLLRALGVILIVVGAGPEFGYLSIISLDTGKLLLTGAFILWGLSGIFGYLSNKPFSVLRPFWADAGERDDPTRAWGAAMSIVVTAFGIMAFLYQLS